MGEVSFRVLACLLARDGPRRATTVGLWPCDRTGLRPPRDYGCSGSMVMQTVQASAGVFAERLSLLLLCRSWNETQRFHGTRSCRDRFVFLPSLAG
jgi:hypothetical protein